MRMHTALHLLSAVLPYPVTGGSVGEAESRLDFDIPEAGLDKDAISAKLAEMIATDAAVTSRWITDAELEANPALVKTMAVKPPMGTGQVRLIEIAGLDLQPCGGTHVRRTGEIGAVRVTQIEKKGKQNRRVRLALVSIGIRVQTHPIDAMAVDHDPCPDPPAVQAIAGRPPTGSPRAWASPNSCVVDGSFYLPALKRDAKAEYLAGHIPGRGVLRHRRHRRSLHRPAAHAAGRRRSSPKAVGALGIGKDDTIVVYDGAGLGGAPRVWWTFRVFGANERLHPRRRLAEVEGRRPAGRVRRGQAHAAQVHAALDTGAGRRWSSDVQLALIDQSAQVVDARPADRFRGEAPEPRPGVRSGHMPGALNVPVTGLIENGRLIAPEQIAQKFTAGGVDLDKPIITSCGSGVTAATLWFALDAIGKAPKALYDGSWTEWGSPAGPAGRKVIARRRLMPVEK